jgi:hypothetical protein
MLLPTIILNTVLQSAAGIVFTSAEVIGPISGFVVLGLLAVWIVVLILRSLTESTRPHSFSAELQGGST